MGPLDLCLNTKISFLCLPTLFNKEKSVMTKMQFIMFAPF